MAIAQHLKTRAEQRLEQLEALERPLTREESDELRRCLHAIYVRNWRLTQSVIGRVDGELPDVQFAARLETGPIADRMEAATDEDWPVTPCRGDEWQDHAREASHMLLMAIEKATVRV